MADQLEQVSFVMYQLSQVAVSSLQCPVSSRSLCQLGVTITVLRVCKSAVGLIPDSQQPPYACAGGSQQPEVLSCSALHFWTCADSGAIGRQTSVQVSCWHETTQCSATSWVL